MSDTMTRSSMNGSTPKTGDTDKPTVVVEPTPQGGRLRRRPMRAVIAIAVAAACALIAASLFATVSNTSSVLVLTKPIARGTVITSDDLTTAQFNGDSAVASIPASQGSQVVGMRASVDLLPGQLLTSDAIATALIPAAGQSVVGISLSAAQLPAMGVQPGDAVRIITTPRAQDDPPAATPQSLNASVVGLGQIDADGRQQVDFTVPQGSAALLAAAGATQRVVVVLDPRER